MSAIHKRIYAALKQEFKLLARVFKLYLPQEYPYDVVGGQRMIKQMDFDDRVDILPVADPKHIFSDVRSTPSHSRNCNWQHPIHKYGSVSSI